MKDPGHKGLEVLHGSILTVLYKDFHQIFPVVKNRTKANFVQAIINIFHLWKHVQVKHLSTNMHSGHLFGSEEAAKFSKLLLEVGSSAIPLATHPDDISIPAELSQMASSLGEQNSKMKLYQPMTRACSDRMADSVIVLQLNENVIG